MDIFEAIHRRRSVGRLIGPGPDRDQMAYLIQAASAAPDHQELSPWRFIVIQEDQRSAFSEVLVAALIARAEHEGVTPTTGQIDKERSKLNRAPTIVVAAGVWDEQATVPASEQLSAVAAAIENFLLAATALGFGSMWRTGPSAYDPSVKAALGLRQQDAIVGWLYVGHIPSNHLEPQERARTVARAIYWNSPLNT